MTNFNDFTGPTIRNAILGYIIGDAVGVPFEGISPESMKEKSVFDILGFGVHNQPPGTWSDDTSLMLCTIESLINGYNLNDIAKKFVLWLKEGYWTLFGEVSDVGRTTLKLCGVVHQKSKTRKNKFLTKN